MTKTTKHIPSINEIDAQNTVDDAKVVAKIRNATMAWGAELVTLERGWKIVGSLGYGYWALVDLPHYGQFWLFGGKTVKSTIENVTDNLSILVKRHQRIAQKLRELEAIQGNYTPEEFEAIKRAVEYSTI